MHFFQKSRSMRHLLSLLAILGFGLIAAITTQASAQTLEVSSGILDGIDGVVVDGGNYNVTFATGRCTAVFSPCDSSADFAFQTESGANDAGNALAAILSTGTVNSSYSNGVVGEVGGNVTIITPFSVSGGTVTGDFLYLSPGSTADEGDLGLSSSFAARGLDGAFADFTPATTSVPEPRTIMLFGAGLLGLGFIYRRRAVKRAV